MGRMSVLWLMTLFVSLSRSAPVSESFAVLSGSSVSVQLGLTATLPCWLSPPQSAEDLEVRWYRLDQFDAPIMLYKAKSIHHQSQNSSYAGRVSFSLKDSTSSGFKSGDVSLKVVNVTVQDAGDYTCFVSSVLDYDSSIVSLCVTETGSPPLLSTVWKEDNMVEVSCESEGWFPHPELHWSDKNKALTTNNLKYGNDSTGLLSVRSQVLVPDSSEVSCSVGFPNTVIKESRMYLGSPQRSQQGGSGSSSAGWVAFGILLLIVLAGAGTLFFRKRLKKLKSGGDQTDGQKLSDDSEEKEKLLSSEMKKLTTLSEASQHYVNVQLVDTNNPLITIRGAILRDNVNKVFPDGHRVTCLTAIRGSPGFSSGQHYWEVSLRKGYCAPKQSWWIGVTNRPDVPQEVSFSPNPSNGFWFLSSSPDQTDAVQFSSESKMFLPVQSKPATVGVYLNYETGELSFYNVEDKCLIGSFGAKFTGEVFPFFNPGIGDQSPMEIIQKSVQVKSNDHEKLQKTVQVKSNDHEKLQETVQVKSNDHEKLQKSVQVKSNDHEKLQKSVQVESNDHEKLQKTVQVESNDHEKLQKSVQVKSNDHEKLQKSVQVKSNDHEKLQKSVQVKSNDHEKLQKSVQVKSNDHEKLQKSVQVESNDHEKLQKSVQVESNDHEKLQKTVQVKSNDHEKLQKSVQVESNDHEKLQKSVQVESNDHENSDSVAEEGKTDQKS